MTGKGQGELEKNGGNWRKTVEKQKRVRDTSLWKFMRSRRQGVNGKFRLCHDTGSACYDCHEFGITMREKFIMLIKKEKSDK